MTTQTQFPEIVLRALRYGVTDIGQITKQDRYQLNKYVKKGVLQKGLGDIFPNAKMVYCLPSIDIAKERKEGIKELFRKIELLEGRQNISISY